MAASDRASFRSPSAGSAVFQQQSVPNQQVAALQIMKGEVRRLPPPVSASYNVSGTARGRSTPSDGSGASGDSVNRTIMPMERGSRVCTTGNGSVWEAVSDASGFSDAGARRSSAMATPFKSVSDPEAASSAVEDGDNSTEPPASLIDVFGDRRGELEQRPRD